MEHPTTIAVDLAKSVFEVAVSKDPGRVCQRRRLTRGQMAAFFANRPAAMVLMEACGTAHFWGRLLRGFGHRVLLLPAQERFCRSTQRPKIRLPSRPLLSRKSIAHSETHLLPHSRFARLLEESRYAW